MKSNPLGETDDVSAKDVLLKGSGREDIVVTALQECQAAVDAGQPIDRAAMLEKYSEIRDELSACLDGLELMRQSASGGDRQVAAERYLSTVTPLATLGDFRIVREIGRGGMGVVYEAEQLSVGRHVALKVLPYAAMLDKKQIARFQNEARAAATLEHPHIVPVYFVGNERGVYYYAMRLINGQDLSEILTELRGSREGVVGDQSAELGLLASSLTEGRGPTADASLDIAAPPSESSRPVVSNQRVDPAKPIAGEETIEDTRHRPQAGVITDHSTRRSAYYESIARLGCQVAEALEFAHAHGVIHRDVKPANIMLDSTGEAWVTDFGLARLDSDRSVTTTGDLVGTLRYMSPEQTLARRGTVDHRTDVYSLGATLYELLTLQPLFDGEDRATLLRQIAVEEPKRPVAIVPNVPRDLQTIVLKTLEKTSDDRYPTARELANDLLAFLAGKPIVARPPTMVDWFTKWSRRNVRLVWLATAASLVVGIVSIIAVVLVLRSQGQLSQALTQQKAAATLAKAAVDDMYVGFAEDWLRQQSGMTTEQRRFLEKAAAFYEKIAIADPYGEGALEAAKTLTRVAKIRRVLGDTGAAYKAAMSAIHLCETRIEREPDSRNTNLRLVAALHEVRELRGAGFRNTTSNRSVCQRQVDICERLQRSHPHDVNVAVKLAEARALLAEYFHGLVDSEKQNYEEADRLIGLAYTTMKRIVVEHPENVEWKKAMILVLDLYGVVVKFRVEGGMTKGPRPDRLALAREIRASGITFARDLYKASPSDPQSRVVLAESLVGMGGSLLTRETVAHMREAVVIWRQLASDFPARVEFQNKDADVYSTLGGTFLALGRYRESIEAYQKSRSLEPAGWQHGSWIRFQNLSSALEHEGRVEEAIEATSRQCEILWHPPRDDTRRLYLANRLPVLAEYYRKHGQDKKYAAVRSQYEAVLHEVSRALQRQTNPEVRDSRLAEYVRYVTKRAVRNGEIEMGESVLTMFQELSDLGPSVFPDGQLAGIQWRIAECNDVLGHADEAIRQLHSLLKEYPGSNVEADARYLLADLLVNGPPEARDASYARQLLESLLKDSLECKVEMRARCVLADILTHGPPQLCDLTYAQQVIPQSLEEGDHGADNYWVHTMLGRIYFLQGDYDKAIAVMTTARKTFSSWWVDPTRCRDRTPVEYWNRLYLAMAYSKVGELEKAAWWREQAADMEGRCPKTISPTVGRISAEANDLIERESVLHSLRRQTKGPVDRETEIVNAMQTTECDINVHWNSLRRGSSSIQAVAPSDSPRTIVPFDSDWDYLDDGSDQGTVWQLAEFDDSAWKSGPAPLGYGRDVVTTVGCWKGTLEITTYFRKLVDIPDPSQIRQLTLRLRYDDGVAVYLNGHTVARDNLDNDARFKHYPNTLVEEIQTRHFAVDPALLVEGANCLAVEAHQDNKASMKSLFDLELVASLDEPDIVDRQSIVRLGNLSPNDGLRVPPGSLIGRAELRLNLKEPISSASVHRLLRPSKRNNDSDNQEGPILTDDIQAVRQADDEWASGTAPKSLTPSFDVTPSVQAWVDGQANHGWLLQSGQEPWRFASSSETNSADPQQLVVHFIPPRQLAQLVWQWTLGEDWSSPMPSEAVEWAQRCMRTEPESIENRLALCVAAYRAGRFEQLLHSLREPGRVFGDADACDWYLRAMIHWQLGRKEEARSWYDKATQRTRVRAGGSPGQEQLTPGLGRLKTEAEKLITDIPSG